jgi:putative methyltransferase (TIGR04325 family)
LRELKLVNWAIVEQKHFVDCGKQFIQDDNLKFFYSIEDAVQATNKQVLLLSSVIQYFEKPYELIDQLKKNNFEYILIDRTAFLESEKERITVQIVPESIYKASYPAWFFNERVFVDAFLDMYQLVTTFDSNFDPREQLEDGVFSYRKGFLFKRR